MKTQIKRALLLCLVLFLFFSVFWQWFGNGGDFGAYIEKIRGKSLDYTFPPLYAWISAPFIFRSNIFILFSLFMFGVVTPLVLVAITKNWISAWFYFATTDYFYYITAGLYNQGLVSILFLGLLATKNNYLRAILFLLGLLSHSTGLWLLGGLWVLLLLKETNLKGFLPFCSPFWGEHTPEILKIEVAAASASYPPGRLTLNSVLAFFVKRCPLPFLYWGLKGIWHEKNWHYLVFIGLAVIIAIIHDQRALYLIPLLIIPGLTWYYASCSINKKRLIFGLSVVWFVFLLSQWFLLSTRLFC